MNQLYVNFGLDFFKAYTIYLTEHNLSDRDSQ